MAHKTVSALNTISGKVGRVPENYLTSPAFRDILVEVPEGTKDYDSEFWKPTDAKGHRAKSTTKSKNARAKAKEEEATAVWVPETTDELTSDAEIR